MVIHARDVVKTFNTAADGEILGKVLRNHLDKGERVSLSFANVYDVPSSFVNTAIVALLDTYSESWIKSHLTIVDATSQIAMMVRRCLANGIRKQAS
jgi:hypothetical protein